MPGMGKSVVRADTIEALAQELGIHLENLKATIANYNAMCQAGVGDMTEQGYRDLIADLEAGSLGQMDAIYEAAYQRYMEG